MDILAFLSVALEKGEITQEQFDEAKKDLESRKSQEEINRIVKERVERAEVKYKPQLEELETLRSENTELKSKVEKVSELEASNTELAGKLSVYEDADKNRKIDGVISNKLSDTEKLIGKPLPKAYLNMIKRSENEDELNTSIDEVLALYKEDNPVYFGGGANPDNTKKSNQGMSSLQRLEEAMSNGE